MYFIVETEEQLAQLPKVDQCFIELMSLSEHTHPALTSHDNRSSNLLHEKDIVFSITIFLKK